MTVAEAVLGDSLAGGPFVGADGLNQAIFTRLYLDAEQTGHAPRATSRPGRSRRSSVRTGPYNTNGGGAVLQGNDTAVNDGHWSTAVLASAMASGCSINRRRAAKPRSRGFRGSSPRANMTRSRGEQASEPIQSDISDISADLCKPD